MVRYILLTSIVLALSCACRSSEEKIDWTIERSESIKHAEMGGKKIQIVYSGFNSGFFPSIDTSMVVEIYKDTLLLERVEYEIRNGDTIKWKRQINEFNADGLVLKEIDSVNGTLRKQVLNFYEEGRLQRAEILSIIPDFNDAMETVGADTTRSTSISIYDEAGKCTKVISVSKDELSSALAGTNRYDTSVTHKQFDEKLRETGSITITRGDTTSVLRMEYDEHGRRVAIAEASDQSVFICKFEYDERGNQISELVTFNGMTELTLTEYDSLNRPASRKTLKPKSAIHKSF